jgi:methyl acetate hydrolase
VIDREKIDALLKSAVGGVPGVVAMATSRDGALYEGAFGVRDVSTDAPMTLDTVFWYASMSKAFTSVAALQLVEQGRLSLDAPISAVLPELADPRVLEGYSDAGAPLLRPAASAITLRHLLTHSAGFGTQMSHPILHRYLEETGLPLSAGKYEDLRELPLLFDPGTRWQYGDSTAIIGTVVQRVSGEALDKYLANRLFEPLQMPDAGVLLNPEQRGRLARCHQRAPGGGGLQPIDHPVGMGPTFMMGGGGFCGTAPDYLRFIRMILNGGSLDGIRILRPETVAAMSENHLGAPFVTGVHATDPAWANDIEFLPGVEKKWGTIGMISCTRTSNGRNPGSSFWAGVCNTYFWIDHTAGIGGILLTQIFPFADPPVLSLFDAFEHAISEGAGG